MGAGAGNLELEESAQVMVETLGQAMATAGYPEEVDIVVDGEAERGVFEAYLRRLPQ